jgi:hypothetical protein
MRRLSMVSRLRLALGLAVLLTLHAAAAERPGMPREAANRDPRISLQVERMPLQALLTTLARESAIAIQVQGQLPDSVVSAAFEQIELREALRRLFAGQSHLLIERAASATTGPVIEVILLGQAMGSESAFTSVERAEPATAAADSAPDRPEMAEARLAQHPSDEPAHTARRARSARTRALIEDPGADS